MDGHETLKLKTNMRPRPSPPETETLVLAAEMRLIQDFQISRRGVCRSRDV